MPKRGVGQQGTVSRPDAHVLCSGDALSSIVWRVVTAGTLDTIEVIEQSVVCAAECSVPSVAAPMCCHWELLSRLARPRDVWRYWRFGARGPGLLASLSRVKVFEKLACSTGG